MRKIIFTIFIIILLVSCKKEKNNLDNLQNQEGSSEIIKTEMDSNTENLLENSKTKKENKITFIELGSVNCVPCRMMQPVMEKIEKKYKDQVKIIFYDVWTEKDVQMAYKYKIRVIPTQVFLDSDGNEFFRHEGYLPFEKVEEILRQKGIK